MELQTTKQKLAICLLRLTNVCIPQQGNFSLEVHVRSSGGQSVWSKLHQSNPIHVKYKKQSCELGEGCCVEVAELEEVALEVREKGVLLGRRVLGFEGHLNKVGFVEYWELVFPEPYVFALTIVLALMPVSWRVKPLKKGDSYETVINQLKKLHYSSHLCSLTILNSTPSISSYLTTSYCKEHDPFLINSQLQTITQTNNHLLSQIPFLYKEPERIEKLWRENQKRVKVLLGEKIIDEDGCIAMEEKSQEGSWRKNKGKRIREQIKNGTLTKQHSMFSMMPNYLRGTFENSPIIFHTKQEKRPRQPSHLPLKNVFVFAHGYQATPASLAPLLTQFKLLFRRSKFLVLSSYTQQMEESLGKMGELAAEQINNYFAEHVHSEQYRVVMVGHSMGGVILRSALKGVKKRVADHLHTFVSMAVPHLSYFEGMECHVEAGLSLIEWLQPVASLRELTGRDAQRTQDKFMWRLSSEGSLGAFPNIVLLSSRSDKYVPTNSARIQPLKAKPYITTMIQNILPHESSIGTIYRMDVDFHQRKMNFDRIIGRESHVQFLVQPHLVQLLFKICFDGELEAKLCDF